MTTIPTFRDESDSYSMTEMMTDATRERLQSLVEQHPVLLFMKGDRAQPQCGFSAQVVQILDRVVPEYHTVDVLRDPEIREGVKEFSDWPTIPQLYIGAEFQGGCDIVREMYGNGELHQALGLPAPSLEDVAEPRIELSPEAVDLLNQARQEYGNEDIHLGIDARFQHSLAFGPPSPESMRFEVEGLPFCLDLDSAQRAEGLKISVQQGPRGPGLLLDNPNAPAASTGDGEPVRDGIPQMKVAEFVERSRTEPLVLVDVRTADERDTAKIDSARWLEEEREAIEQLDKSTPIVFHCHHGGRSQRAALEFKAKGFENVHNLAGGIDAWSREVDSDVPRY